MLQWSIVAMPENETPLRFYARTMQKLQQEAGCRLVVQVFPVPCNSNGTVTEARGLPARASLMMRQASTFCPAEQRPRMSISTPPFTITTLAGRWAAGHENESR
jgi:hypothetical protein